MRKYVLMWETPGGERRWETVRDNQLVGFFRKLIEEDGVHPATVMAANSPIGFHYVWKEYHEGLSSVNFNRINEEIYGTEPVQSQHKPVDVPVQEKKPPMKYGWLAPDGRFFGCDYGNHTARAAKIVGEVEYVFDPEQRLEDLGWAKVFSGSIYSERYAVGMGVGKKLTNAQLKALQEMELDHAHGVCSLL